MAILEIVEKQNLNLINLIHCQARTHTEICAVSLRHWICQSTFLWATCQHTDTDRDTSTHTERIIFSLCCNASESPNRNCQQEKSPILQLCPCRSSTLCGLSESKEKTAKISALWEVGPGPLKGTEQPGHNQEYHNWTRSLGINSTAYIRDLHQRDFIFHLLHTISDKTLFNFRTVWTIDFFRPIPPPSPFSQPLSFPVI